MNYKTYFRVSGSWMITHPTQSPDARVFEVVGRKDNPIPDQPEVLLLACGRSVVRTPLSVNWEQYKAYAVTDRCAKCEASKQAEINRKSDAKKGL